MSVAVNAYHWWLKSGKDIDLPLASPALKYVGRVPHTSQCLRLEASSWCWRNTLIPTSNTDRRRCRWRQWSIEGCTELLTLKNAIRNRRIDNNNVNETENNAQLNLVLGDSAKLMIRCNIVQLFWFYRPKSLFEAKCNCQYDNDYVNDSFHTDIQRIVFKYIYAKATKRDVRNVCKCNPKVLLIS